MLGPFWVASSPFEALPGTSGTLRLISGIGLQIRRELNARKERDRRFFPSHWLVLVLLSATDLNGRSPGLLHSKVPLSGTLPSPG